VYLVMRRVVFLGLVLANLATLGAAAAEVVGWPPETLSLAMAVAGAAALGQVDASNTVTGESLMGWAYAAASSATVLILSQVAGGGSHAMELLYGNILAVQVSHVIGLAALAAGVVVAQLLFMRRLVLVTVDAESAQIAGIDTRRWSLALNLSIGIVASAAVHEIGALSTFALLSLPSLTALLVSGGIRSAFVLAAALGVLIPVVALILSFYLDLPSGPACVALLALVALAAILSRVGRSS
jgi:ABC-type Mn2+/Zn2+ transport system permease subunit